MDLALFDYPLPSSSIAQAPAERRDASRLLCLDRARSAWTDHRFADLPELLREGDCLVVNNSRVIPARVDARDGAGRSVELLFVEPEAEGRWWAMVRPGRRCRPGAELRAGGEAGLTVRVVAVAEDGTRLMQPLEGSVESLLASDGLPPLPPYIERHRKPDAEDSERYQTVYARPPGSIAAPTAGLHFTPALLQRLRAIGVEVHEVTLHVGPGTFRPIQTPAIEDHALPGERVQITPEVAAAVNHARRQSRRVVAVGTTTTRALEAAATGAGEVRPLEGRAGLYITPGHRFQIVDALLTNFHLPRSSLLVLVAAFAGRELVLDAYRHAVAAGYRFYSYGDAMLIV